MRSLLHAVTGLILVALGFLGTLAPTARGQGIASADQLVRMTPEQLSALYRAAPPAPIPTGRVRGQALVRPGTRLAPTLSRAAGLVWQGKVFGGDATVTNRFFGVKIIRARVDYGPSWMDGGPALVLDYQDTSHLYAKYRDEIRQVGAGVYLGVMYERTTPCPRIKMFFALEVCR